jgi:hypothetical protein
VVQHRILILALVLALVAIGTLVFLKRARPAPPVAETTTAPAPVPRRAPPASEPAPAPAPAAPSVTNRRAPKPSAAPAPAAPPVAAAPETATLHFTSDVPGAQIFIDRQFVGATPVTAEHVTPGSHQVNASVEGFDGIAETIDVEPGPREIPFRFREIRLDARLAVVHKHRFGSCTGQLSATARGLRYDTSNSDDAFNVALADIESIDVDYLQKNLRVKLRTGRQYNFTDPDGNADRLFVFQRDVEKARQRLARGDQPVEK